MLSRLTSKIRTTGIKSYSPAVSSIVGQSHLRRGYFHIPNMNRETMRKNIQDEFDANNPVVKTDKVYKPTYTIEFNRVGEVLLYSCEPTKHMQIYMKYPYILYESCIPLCMFMWYVNPFALAWNWNYLNIAAIMTLWWPRIWHWTSIKYRPRRVYLLRGGRYVKIETSTLAGDRCTVWAENQYFNVLTEDTLNFDNSETADFLNEEGQLKYETVVQMEHYREQGTTVQNQLINFMKEGVVHEPELFEAVLKGYNIDTTDFVINTENNFRARDAIHNL